MRINIFNAAEKLSISPANIMLYLSQLGIPFEDCWPDVEAGIIDTIGQILCKHHLQQRNENEVSETSEVTDEEVEWTLSEKALKIIDKLWRKDKWGSKYVPLVSLSKMTGLDSDACREAIYELKESGLLIIRPEKGDAISLSTHHKNEIDNICQNYINRG